MYFEVFYYDVAQEGWIIILLKIREFIWLLVSCCYYSYKLQATYTLMEIWLIFLFFKKDVVFYFARQLSLLNGIRYDDDKVIRNKEEGKNIWAIKEGPKNTLPKK